MIDWHLILDVVGAAALIGVIAAVAGVVIWAVGGDDRQGEGP